MTEWRNWGTRQKNLAAILLTIGIAGGCYFYLIHEQSEASVSSAAVPVRPFQPAKQVVPEAATMQPAAVLRDPFVVPGGAASLSSSARTGAAASAVAEQPQGASAGEPGKDASQAYNGTGQTDSDSGRNVAVSDSPSMRLTGIVSAGDTKVGIIAYGSESRSYHRQDHVGPYEIVAIDEKSITLSGPEGQKILELGQAEP